MREFTKVILPGNQSVCDFLEFHTPKKLLSILATSTSSAQGKNETAFEIKDEPGEITFKRNDVKYRIRGFNKDGFEKIVQIVVEIDGKIFPDKIDLSRSQGRSKFANALALEFEISPAVINKDLAEIYSHLDKLQDDRFKEKAGLHVEELHVITRTEEKRAKDVLASRDILNEMLIKDTEKLGHVGEDINKKLYYLSAISRMTNKPLSVLVIASSGSGKSFGLSTVMDLTRPEGLLKYSRITTNALYYKTEDDLKGKILYLEELVGMEHAFESIRMLLSSGYLAVSVPEKDPRTGVMRTVERRMQVNIPIISSGTRDYFDDETMSRFLITYNDETYEHKKRILKAQAYQYSLEGEKAFLHRDRILKKYRDFDAVLNPEIMVVNPYANKIMVNPDLHIVTRKQEQYLRLMYNIAFLRQYSKEQKIATDRFNNSFKYVEVDKRDIETANEIAYHIFQYARGDLSKNMHDAYLKIKSLIYKKSETSKRKLLELDVTKKELMDNYHWPETTARRYLTELVNHEYLIQTKKHSTRQFSYRLLFEETTKSGENSLKLLNPNNL